MAQQDNKKSKNGLQEIGEFVKEQNEAKDPLADFFINNDESQLSETRQENESVLSEILLSKTRQYSGDVREYLHFSLGVEHYAIELNRIKEIIKVKDVTPVPRTPSYVAGIISLRGQIVPLYRLSLILELQEKEFIDSNLVLVVEGAEGEVAGLVVTLIHNVIRISDKAIEAPPATVAGVGREFIYGIGRVDEHMVIMLDLDAVFRGKE